MPAILAFKEVAVADKFADDETVAAIAECPAERCRSFLHGVESDKSELEVMALCRARLPPPMCKRAHDVLGSHPWDAEDVHNICAEWDVASKMRQLTPNDEALFCKGSFVPARTLDTTAAENKKCRSPYLDPPVYCRLHAHGVLPFLIESDSLQNFPTCLFRITNSMWSTGLVRCAPTGCMSTQKIAQELHREYTAYQDSDFGKKFPELQCTINEEATAMFWKTVVLQDAFIVTFVCPHSLSGEQPHSPVPPLETIHVGGSTGNPICLNGMCECGVQPCGYQG